MRYKKNLKIIFISIVAILILLYIVYLFYLSLHRPVLSQPQTQLPLQTTMVTIEGKAYTAEIADTPALQTQGLSDRASLPADHIMLFVFDHPQAVGIWMKDMNFSLDIIWLDAAGTIVTVQKNVSPSTYPNAFYPTEPAFYVIEANPGFVDSNHLQVGSVIPIHL